MTYPPFILGSASPWRQTILQQHGFDFIVKPANIDEKAIRHHDPQQLVQLLAMAKARALIPHHRDQIIVTCDQVVYCQNEIREKPENEAEAKAIFTKLCQASRLDLLICLHHVSGTTSHRCGHRKNSLPSNTRSSNQDTYRRR